MRKNVFGRRFKRDKNERKALFKGLLSSLVLKKRIKTTEEKAKAIKGTLDKVITKAKKHGKNSSYLLGEYLNAEAFFALTSEMLPHLDKRQSGYTRIIRLGKRFNDNAQMVIMEWVDEFPKLPVQALENKTKRTVKEKKVAKKETTQKKRTASKKEQKTKVSKTKK